jgi:hypothetical protein
MKVTDERLAASMAMKDIIRDALLIKPMSYSEMLIHFNLDRGKLTNHMTQLKKYGFVKYAESERHMPKDKRKYYVVADMGSYADMMSERRAVNSQMTWKDTHKAEILPNARHYSADKYHTTGNRTKVSAWHGYSSMGGF